MKYLLALVGMKHRGTEKLVASLPQGEALLLIRDASTKFDPNAVQVWARGEHVGFLKASQVFPIARALDTQISLGHGPQIPATLAIDGGRWPMVEIEL